MPAKQQYGSSYRGTHKPSTKEEEKRGLPATGLPSHRKPFPRHVLFSVVSLPLQPRTPAFPQHVSCPITVLDLQGFKHQQRSSLWDLSHRHCNHSGIHRQSSKGHKLAFSTSPGRSDASPWGWHGPLLVAHPGRSAQRPCRYVGQEVQGWQQADKNQGRAMLHVSCEAHQHPFGS